MRGRQKEEKEATKQIGGFFEDSIGMQTRPPTDDDDDVEGGGGGGKVSLLK